MALIINLIYSPGFTYCQQADKSQVKNSNSLLNSRILELLTQIFMWHLLDRLCGYLLDFSNTAVGNITAIVLQTSSHNFANWSCGFITAPTFQLFNQNLWNYLLSYFLLLLHIQSIKNYIAPIFKIHPSLPPLEFSIFN